MNHERGCIANTRFLQLIRICTVEILAQQVKFAGNRAITGLRNTSFVWGYKDLARSGEGAKLEQYPHA